MTREEHLKKLKKALYLKDPYSFCKHFWSEADSSPIIENWILEYYVDTFLWATKGFIPETIKSHWISDNEYEKVVAQLKKKYPGYVINDLRNNKRNLSINICPRHSKSMFFNVLMPTWLATISKLQIASVSHITTLSGGMNTKRQRIINSDKYRDVFGKIRILENTKTKLVLDNGSEMYSVATSSMTGFGGDVIILDDLINAEDADKQQESFATGMAFLQHTLPSRLNNPEKTGVLINIQQRLSTNDPTGYFKEKQSEDYNFITMPAIFSENIIFISPINGSYKIFENGSFLWKDRFGDYSKLRRQVGRESVFRAQYLQEPSKESDYLKESYFNYMTIAQASDILNSPEYVYASHDLPIKDKKSNDLHGTVLAYYKDNILLIVDAVESHRAYEASEKYIRNLHDKSRMITQLVEDKANGAVVIQRLQSNIPGIIKFDPKQNSKGQRLEVAGSRMESKNVYFLISDDPEQDARIKTLVDRLLSFPMVKHDDIIDAFTQLVIHVFEERQFGIFTESMSKFNELHEMPYTTITNSAVTREGQLYKYLNFTYDGKSDSFWVLKEDRFYATEIDAIERLRELQEETKSRVLIDATDEQVIYQSFSGKIRGLINYSDNRSLGQKIMQIQVGIGARNIKWMRDCVELKRDIAICAYDKAALERGIEKLAGSEGLVACMRAGINFYKGSNDFRIDERNR